MSESAQPSETKSEAMAVPRRPLLRDVLRGRARILWALIIAVPLIAVLALGFGRDPNAVASPLLNHQAPAFTLTTLSDRPFSLAQLRGRPVVMNFWASWCVGCKIEHPYLVAAWHTYEPKGVIFVGVLFNDNATSARAFMRDHGGGWPIVQDPGLQTAVAYGVTGIPETFFIDRRGIVRYKSTGVVTPGLLHTQIERLLQSQR